MIASLHLTAREPAEPPDVRAPAVFAVAHPRPHTGAEVGAQPIDPGSLPNDVRGLFDALRRYEPVRRAAAAFAAGPRDAASTRDLRSTLRAFEELDRAVGLVARVGLAGEVSPSPDDFVPMPVTRGGRRYVLLFRDAGTSGGKLFLVPSIAAPLLEVMCGPAVIGCARGGVEKKPVPPGVMFASADDFQKAGAASVAPVLRPASPIWQRQARLLGLTRNDDRAKVAVWVTLLRHENDHLEGDCEYAAYRTQFNVLRKWRLIEAVPDADALTDIAWMRSMAPIYRSCALLERFGPAPQADIWLWRPGGRQYERITHLAAREALARDRRALLAELGLARSTGLPDVLKAFAARSATSEPAEFFEGLRVYFSQHSRTLNPTEAALHYLEALGSLSR